MPCEMWCGKKPRLSHLRIFGSILHVKTPGALGKLEDRSKDMVFLGYERGSKSYQCFNPTTDKVHLSHDFIFKKWCKWNSMEGQLREGMPFKQFCVSGVHLGFENLSERMEKGRANIEGLFHDVPSNEEARHTQGSA